MLLLFLPSCFSSKVEGAEAFFLAEWKPFHTNLILTDHFVPSQFFFLIPACRSQTMTTSACSMVCSTPTHTKEVDLFIQGRKLVSSLLLTGFSPQSHKLPRTAFSDDQSKLVKFRKRIPASASTSVKPAAQLIQTAQKKSG